MNKLFILASLLGLLNQTTAQQIKLLPIYSISSYNKVQNGFGYGVGYEININSNDKLDFLFTNSFITTSFSYIFFSSGDGKDYYRKVKPSNQIISISSCYKFNLYRGTKSEIYIGPKLIINFFKIKESIVENEVNNTQTRSYTDMYWKNNKFGLGSTFEYERKIIADKLSLSLATEPQFVFFTKFGLEGSDDPPIITLWSFNFNIKYNFAKN
ncbi:MAG: hypothetical protein IPM34_14745 [Saprospiraceae bacterium]|nr:hypothetical protein [Saprospiraceae bacterium]